MDISQTIGMIPVLQAANPVSQASLASYSALRKFKKGEHLFLDRDEVRHVYFLTEGTAALYKIGNKQEKKVIFIYGAGAMLNETVMDEKCASINCELLSDAKVLHIERQSFLYVCEKDVGLSRAVMGSVALKIRRLYHQMKNTGGSLRGDRRIAAKLWKLSRDHGIAHEGGVRISFDLSITYLADLLGSKRETVSRQLRSLTERGLVVIERNHFTIPDRDKLKKYYDEV